MYIMNRSRTKFFFYLNDISYIYFEIIEKKLILCRAKFVENCLIQIAIFIPEAKAIQIIDNIDESRYCINIDSLPI